jgi:hypothetical protein
MVGGTGFWPDISRYFGAVIVLLCIFDIYLAFFFHYASRQWDSIEPVGTCIIDSFRSVLSPFSLSRPRTDLERGHRPPTSPRRSQHWPHLGPGIHGPGGSHSCYLSQRPARGRHGGQPACLFREIIVYQIDQVVPLALGNSINVLKFHFGSYRCQASGPGGTSGTTPSFSSGSHGALPADPSDFSVCHDSGRAVGSETDWKEGRRGW